jgi:CRISPR-associated exonuclease Cas4
MADAVEFHRVVEGGIRLPDAAGLWIPFPVEYKRGRPKRERCDEVQVCAQAICLEEMLNVSIPEGALFYGSTRRRFEVTFDALLHQATEAAAARLHTLIAAGITPAAVREPKCDRCSLLEQCMPQALSGGRSAQQYLQRAIREKGPGDG